MLSLLPRLAPLRRRLKRVEDRKMGSPALPMSPGGPRLRAGQSNHISIFVRSKAGTGHYRAGSLGPRLSGLAQAIPRQKQQARTQRQQELKNESSNSSQ